MFIIKTKFLYFQIFSTIFVIILGSLLHFVYDWSSQNPIIANFSAVNESTWEHLKLLFFPMLITVIIGLFIFSKDLPNFLCAKTIGIIVALLFIVIFFYTYTGVFGINSDILNITSFVVAVIFGEFTAYKLVNSNLGCNNLIATIAIIALSVCFLLFTYVPPKIPLFRDPINSTYGIKIS